MFAFRFWCHCSEHALISVFTCSIVPVSVFLPKGFAHKGETLKGEPSHRFLVQPKAPPVINGASASSVLAGIGPWPIYLLHLAYTRTQAPKFLPVWGPSVALVRPIEPLTKSESPITWTRRAKTKFWSKPSPRFRCEYMT